VTTSLRDIYRASTKNRDIFFNRYIARPAAVPFIWALQYTRVTPNQVTVGSFILALIACLMFVTIPGYWGVLGGVLMLEASYVLDCVDGQLARIKGQSSKVGALFDFLMDELKAFFFLGAITTRMIYVDTEPQCWMLWGLWGMVALGSGIALTTLIRREEYSGTQQRFDGEHDAAAKPTSIIGWGVWLANAVSRWIIHYPSYMLYLGIAGTLKPYLIIYPVILWVYFLKTMLSVTRRLTALPPGQETEKQEPEEGDAS